MNFLISVVTTLLFHSNVLVFASTVDQLLRPLETSQIIIVARPPYNPTVPDVLLKSMEWFTAKEIPVQIFTSRSDSRQCPLRSHVRHGSPSFVWLSAVQVLYPQEAIELHYIFRNMAIWRYHFIRGLNIYKDLLNVIVDLSTVPTWESAYKISTQECLIPSNFVLVEWSNSENFVLVSTKIWRIGVYCSNGQRKCLLPYPHYAKLLIKDISMTEIIENIRRTRSNFNEFQLEIVTNRAQFEEWNFWKRIASMAKMKRTDPKLPTGKLLMTIAKKHNMTFRTVNPQQGPRCWQGGFQMAASYQTHHWIEGSYIPPLIFNEFVSFQTFLSSDLAHPNPFMLSSLREPVAPSMACATLISAAVVLAALLTLRTVRRDKAGAIFLVLSAMVAQTSTIRMSARQAQLYTFWVMSVLFISMFYTNMMQSAIVAPNITHTEMSLEDMAAQNFTLLVSSVTEAFVKEMVQTAGAHSGKESTELDGTIMGKETKLRRMMRWDPSMDSACDDVSLLTQPKQAMLLWGMEISMWFYCVKEMGRNFDAGKDRFFSIPSWWNFDKAPSGDTLARTVESIIETGFVSYSSQLVDKIILAEMGDKLRNGSLRAYVKDIAEASTDAGTLTESLIKESIAIFAYGSVVAMGIFALENIWTKVMQLRLSVRKMTPVEAF